MATRKRINEPIIKIPVSSVVGTSDESSEPSERITAEHGADKMYRDGIAELWPKGEYETAINLAHDYYSGGENRKILDLASTPEVKVYTVNQLIDILTDDDKPIGDAVLIVNTIGRSFNLFGALKEAYQHCRSSKKEHVKQKATFILEILGLKEETRRRVVINLKDDDQGIGDALRIIDGLGKGWDWSVVAIAALDHCRIKKMEAKLDTLEGREMKAKMEAKEAAIHAFLGPHLKR